MKYLLSLTILAVAIGLPLLGLAQSSADCAGSQVIQFSQKKRSFAFPAPADRGGELAEISNRGACPSGFQREHHTQWFRFVSPFSGWLGIELVPELVADDYDLLVYPDTLAESCAAIVAEELCPVRAIISRNDTSIASRTGLSLEGMGIEIPIGPGAAFGELLSVKKGEAYYLVVDNVYGGEGGFQLNFSYFFQPKIQVRVVDSVSREGIVAEVGLHSWPDSSLIAVDSSLASGYWDTEPFLPYGTQLYLSIQAEKYLKRSFPLKRKRLRGMSREPLEVALLSLAEGTVIQLDNVLFRGGLAIFLPASYPTLEKLHQLLVDQPDLHIQIEGHVNAAGSPPSQWESPTHKRLSQQRAEAVQQYLIKRGIAPDRLSAQGFAATRMLHPYTMGERQMQQNRRVEVRIVSTAGEE
ncbi:MAG: OmpA family protein [Bacteroidota bacterium]